jgi:hypothetical protein
VLKSVKAIVAKPSLLRIALLCILLSVITGCATNQTPAESPKTLLASRGFVLEGYAAERLFSQCTRTAPKPQGWWQPDTISIENLRAAFTTYSRWVIDSRRFSISNYYCQYAGFTQGNRKLIYCNFFTISPHEESLRKDWDVWLRTHPQIVCDGGDEFFGVVYDVEKRKFFDYKPNGRLRSRH